MTITIFICLFLLFCLVVFLMGAVCVVFDKQRELEEMIQRRRRDEDY